LSGHSIQNPNDMKKMLFLQVLLLLTLSVAAQVTPQITSWVINTTGATGYNSLPSNVQTVQYSATQVYVSASCIPGYSIGPWTANPNTPTNQNFVCKFTRTPVQNTGAVIYTALGNMGLWSNGVAIFNPKDGQYWSGSAFVNGSTTTGFNRNALVYEGISFDNCLGHPAPNGAYHNHVNPACLYNSTLTTVHSPIIGYAFDGFPVYGAYAYTNTNGTGAIKRMVSSYVLAASTGFILLGANTASAAATPSTATTRTGGPPVNSTYPLGNMCEDYIYTAGSGDLDDHNGRFCVTPEYPSGTYAYFVTLDASGNPAYPFVLGPTYYGTVQAGNTGPGGSHVTISESTTVYTPSTGIEESLGKTIHYEIIPNPTQDFVYIHMDNESKNNVKATLFDSNGKMVLSQEYLQPSLTYSLDMSTLPSGLYVLVMEADQLRATQKIIKEK
jgi:hypothetical protein